MSCHKDKSAPPQIEIILPLSTASYSFGDTIHVVAKVYDDISITKLTCYLGNSFNAPVLPVAEFNSNQTHYTIDFFYVISNKEIQTGVYRLIVFASDEESDTRAFRTIMVNELPRELKNVFISGFHTGNFTTIYKTDSGNNPVLVSTNTGDFIGAGILNRYELFITSGKFNGSLNAFQISNMAPEWSIPNLANGGFPYFTSLCFDKEIIYAGYQEGKIIGYNYLKNQQFFAETDINSYPVKMLSYENRLVVVEDFIFGGGKNLIIYNNPGGAILKVTPLNMNVTCMLGKNSTEFYILGNENGKGKISVCDLSSGIISLRQSLASDSILDATRINEYFLILSTSSGLVEFDYNNNNLVPLLTGNAKNKVKYEPVNNEVYVTDNHLLNIYGYQLHNLILLNSFALPDSILSVDFFYNRESFE